MSGNIKRGALIVFEGCDRSGKSTQCRKLVKKIGELGLPVQLLQFPDRSTATGSIINNYLEKKEELTDQAIHLIFSANRWECEPKIKQLLYEGTTLVIDRYSFSGVAYSTAKPNLNFEWCCKPEEGLPKPDVVFLLNVSEKVLLSRAGFGDERYEKSEFQQTALKNLLKLKDDTWKVIDADKGIEEIHEEITSYAEEVIDKVQNTELKVLW